MQLAIHLTNLPIEKVLPWYSFGVFFFLNFTITMAMAAAASRNSRRRAITMAAISPPLSPLLEGGAPFPITVMVCDGRRCGVVCVDSGSGTVMAGEGTRAVGIGEGSRAVGAGEVVAMGWSNTAVDGVGAAAVEVEVSGGKCSKR